MKRLIVNADDLGHSKGINEGIIKGYKDGIVTSTSLMVYGQAVDGAIDLIKKNPGLGVGLHFQIKDYDWNLLWNLKKVVAAILIEDTKKEFLNQIKIFQKLTDKMPDHIDGHYHVHRMPRIYRFIHAYGRENHIPLRGDVNFIRSFFGKSSNEAVTVGNLVGILRNLPDGISELMCHPGFVSVDLKSSYLKQREIELGTLTSPEIKRELKRLRIELIPWNKI